MEEAFVRGRGWISHADLLDLLGAANLVPGPSETEMAIHIGHQRAGWRRLVVAHASLIRLLTAEVNKSVIRCSCGNLASFTLADQPHH